MAELQLKDKTYHPVRLKLRKWLEFEKSQEAVTKAVEDKNIEEYARQLYVLISTALNVEIEDVYDAPWFEVIGAYALLTNLNKVKEIPLLQSRHTNNKKEVAWEYEGRGWYWWVHLFGKNYGWRKEDVEPLDIDDAISLLQEILLDEQFNKEWQWNLSEIAYPYNATTKKSEHKPLPRPEWMEGKKVFLPATRVKFRKGTLPLGMIIGEDGHERIVN